jgi:hypothetical protein
LLYNSDVFLLHVINLRFRRDFIFRWQDRSLQLFGKKGFLDIDEP